MLSDGGYRGSGGTFILRAVAGGMREDLEEIAGVMVATAFREQTAAGVRFL